MTQIELYFLVSIILFCLGIMIVLIKKNGIMILMGIELMLNAANINFVAFAMKSPDAMEGIMFSIFLIVMAAAEAAVALAIILRVYRHYQTTDVDDITELNG
ncbi:NADH-quinone oxidoreductase subunit NuoK [Marinigracilibium pacificum]|uniref:NADH-quinone oxidoreductase subunit K n=1 Tax=Marinigracilibium pacificum TaxID=2729599 RepID=A0A848IXE8_9BACT|nr:NADH-quinone oxidoreductase subunit NuoK [Marinigracilibium pacificum]NMM48977.1 NADH-quinone oxidoreductase subunit NuoK [Marinigracilibium pacificum]